MQISTLKALVCGRCRSHVFRLSAPIADVSSAGALLWWGSGRYRWRICGSTTKPP